MSSDDNRRWKRGITTKTRTDTGWKKLQRSSRTDKNAEDESKDENDDGSNGFQDENAKEEASENSHLLMFVITDTKTIEFTWL